jgi:hypothetical protein
MFTSEGRIIYNRENGMRRIQMTDERIKALWKKGIQLMGEQYT